MQTTSVQAKLGTIMLLTIVSKGAVCCDVDTLLFAIRDKIVLWKEGVSLDLIYDLYKAFTPLNQIPMKHSQEPLQLH